jgi:hypothetical protein
MFPLNYVQDRNRDNPAFCYMAASAKLGASSKSLTAFFTASTSMSMSFPVTDVMTVQLPLSSAGRNRLAFSVEENSATLDRGTKQSMEWPHGIT